MQRNFEPMRRGRARDGPRAPRATSEQIADGAEGLWFTSGDAASLASALERVKDDALVARLSRAAYESYWREPPTLNRHVEQTLAVYDEVLARRRG